MSNTDEQGTLDIILLVIIGAVYFVWHILSTALGYVVCWCLFGKDLPDEELELKVANFKLILLISIGLFVAISILTGR